MMNIITHLRTFSRQSKAEYYSLDVNNVIDESFFMVGEQLRLRNVEIIKSLDPELPKIMGDTNQLEQVFLNLITNARDAIMEKNEKANPSPGNTESIEITTKRSDTDANFIEILFKDSGNGIEEKDQTNIFDPFYTTKEVGKGTGLGLSISYGIISEHNGRIEVAETGPAGTTFIVKLPIADAITSDGRQTVEKDKIRKTA
jgi:histidine kinase